MTKLAALLLVGLLQAQAPVPTEKDKKDDAKRRREQAVFLLRGLADDAAKFADGTLRARVQARAANVLWPTDRERALALFNKAWESAGLAYADAKRRHDEDVRSQREKGGPIVVFGLVDVREEVLRLAATRDRALGEKYFAALAESAKREAEAARTPAGPVDPFSQLPDAMAKRLQLAESLLRRDDVPTALQFADPALDAVSQEAVEFLTNLRIKDAAAADDRHARLVARAAADPASDANTVSVLSAYVFSPHNYLIFNNEGNSRSTRRPNPNEPEASAASRGAFLQAASQVLLRPLTPEQVDQTSAGRRGTWLLIGYLLPRFVEHAGHLVEPMRARQNALGLDPAALAAQQEDIAQDPNDASADDPGSRIDRLLDRARRTEDTAERDVIFMEAALAASRAEDPRLGEIVGGISDDAPRRDMRVWIDYERANRAIGAGNVDRVLEVARKGELTPMLKAWAFVAAARRLAKDDKTRAGEVLAEAADAARDIELKDPDRARALFAVATVTIDVDPKLVRERAAEAVYAANKAEGFTGEDGVVRMVLRARGSTWATSSSFGESDISRVFAHLAGSDLDEAELQAKGFTAEAPRAGALLTVAQTVLTASKKP